VGAPVNVHGLWLRMLSAHARLDEASADGAGLMVALESAGETDEAEALGRDMLVALEIACATIYNVTRSAREAHDGR
jgi:hypothetical protein